MRERGNIHWDDLHALRTSALLLPLPGPIHSGAGVGIDAGAASLDLDELATGTFWLEAKVARADCDCAFKELEGGVAFGLSSDRASRN
jgi:hypothetical protein